MAQHSWNLTLEDGRHTVTLDKPRFGGRRVLVDGVEVARPGPEAGWIGADTPFTLGSHPCYVRSTTNGLRSHHDLVIDGRSVSTGLPLGPYLPLPTWHWVFVLGCLGLVPTGGLIGALVGLPGAVGCRRIARNPSDTVAARVALCLMVTLLAWGLYLVLANLVLGGLRALGWPV